MLEIQTATSLRAGFQAIQRLVERMGDERDAAARLAVLEDHVRRAIPTTGQVEQLRAVRAIPQYQITLRTEP